MGSSPEIQWTALGPHSSWPSPSSSPASRRTISPPAASQPVDRCKTPLPTPPAVSNGDPLWHPPLADILDLDWTPSSGRPGMRAGRSRRGPIARSLRQATDGDTTIDLGFPEFEAQKAKLLGQETTPRSCLHRAPTAVGVFPGGAQELTPRGVPRQATSWGTDIEGPLRPHDTAADLKDHPCQHGDVYREMSNGVPLLWCADVIDQAVPSHLRLR